MALDMQSIYILASGGSRAMEQLDTATNNIANVNTDGFKKLFIKEMSQRLDENGGDANHLFVFPRFEQSVVDLSQGALKKSDSPLDFAIDGSGFFVVQQGDQKLLTRNGHFHLNQDGILVDSRGNEVLDIEDKPIKLNPKAPFSLTQDGKIYQKNKLVAQLQIKNYDKIEPLGETYYKPASKEVATSFKLHQGFLEGSNINPVLQMSELIMAQRRFEMYSNIIKGLDQLNQKTNEIGKA